MTEPMINARELLASERFQMMSLAERGAWITDEVRRNPPPRRRRKVTFRERRTLARRYGARSGRVTPAKCLCGEPGEIRWDTGRILFVGLEIDHVRPLARGGTNLPDNLQLLCPRCNRSKGARWED